MTNNLKAKHWPEDPTPLNSGYVVMLGCMYCGNTFAGPEPQTCCDGRECGCRGLPTHPVICSPQCWEAFSDKDACKNAVLFGGDGKVAVCSDCGSACINKSEIQQGMCFACQYSHAN